MYRSSVRYIEGGEGFTGHLDEYGMTINLDPVSQDSSAVLRSSTLLAAPNAYNLRYVLAIAFVSSAGVFLCGYDLALIAGALPFLTREFGLSAAMSGWTAGSAAIGAIIGPLLGLWFADAIGRRRTMMAAAMLFLGSTIGCAVAA